MIDDFSHEDPHNGIGSGQLAKRTRYCWLLLTAWWLLAGAGLTQELLLPPAGLSHRDAFELWNGCAPMRLFVEELPDDAADIDLTKERIQTLAESRLRVARLYDAALPPAPYLYVRVSVLVSENRRGGAFSIDVSFQKYLRDAVSGRSMFAEAWNTGSYGTHSGDADYIMQGVSEYLDEFILEYLRANETACR